MCSIKKVELKFCFVDGADEQLEPPALATEGSSGFDLRASVPLNLAGIRDAIQIPVGSRALIGSGLCLEIPAGYEGQVRPRSGLALKHGITVLNAPGTIDCDYRGEVGVILINHGEEPYTVYHGDRIAQIVIQSTVEVTAITEGELSFTKRGTGGFGSSGKS